MKLRTTQRDLLTAAKKATTAISQRTPLEALSHVQISVNGAITLTGSDMDTTITGRLTGTSEGDGSLLVPGRLLSTYASKLPAGADVVMTHENNRLLIEAGRSRFDIPTLPSENYPRLAHFEGATSGTFTEADVSRLKAATVAASTDEFRPAMQGVCVHEGTAVATDGFRLVRYALSDGATLDVPTIIPAPAIRALSMFDGDVEFAMNETHIRFTDGETTVTTRLIDEQYPNVATVIPTTHATTIRIDRPELLEVVTRVAIASNEQTRRIDLDIEPGTVKVSASDIDTARTAVESVTCEVEGEHMGISFNAKFLDDALSKLLTAQTIEARLLSALKPAVMIDPANPDDVLSLLMPIRRDK